MGLYYTYLSDSKKFEVGGYDDNESRRYAGSLVYDDGEFESTPCGKEWKQWGMLTSAPASTTPTA